ncbi:MAG TPA: DUF3105 domain-containing protein [Anaerolineales bacterium]
MASRRQRIQEKRQRQRLKSRLIWGGIALVVLIGVGYVLWLALRPSVGESVSVMPDTSHIQEGVVPGPYNSDPPTSGPHYATDLRAGFYDESDLATLPGHPEGYLVHNLEHGYVIFWYNCDVIDEQQCLDIKSEIRSVIDDFNEVKVIAFPWESIEEPVVMTSWGRMQRFEEFDRQLAAAFVERNRNRSPEPNAP